MGEIITMSNLPRCYRVLFYFKDFLLQDVNVQDISEYLILIIRFLVTDFEVLTEYFSYTSFRAKVLFSDC